jgi:hypothetical protein
MNQTHRLTALPEATDLALLTASCALGIPEEQVVTLAVNCYIHTHSHLKETVRLALGKKWSSFQSESNEATRQILMVPLKPDYLAPVHAAPF